MRAPLLVVLALVTSLTPLVSTSADDERSTDYRPLPAERLDEPIELADCQPFFIVEWRSTPGLEARTGPSPRAVEVANRMCARAVKAFFPFAVSRGLRPGPPTIHRIPVCLMPGRGAVGKAYRNLNDTLWRFAHRRHRTDTGGDLWGYFHHNAPYVFLLNDVFNAKGQPTRGFAMVFSHEIWHAMAHRHRLYRKKGAHERDEELARDFTESLGLGR